jgi:hypothetical protein
MDVILLFLVISCMHHCVCGRRNLNSGNNTDVYILNEKNNSLHITVRCLAREKKILRVISDVSWDVRRGFRILIKKTNYIAHLETVR